MAVKLRLTRVGKTKQPQYRVIAADSRRARDGRFIEILGQYNPRTEPSTITIDNVTSDRDPKVFLKLEGTNSRGIEIQSCPSANGRILLGKGIKAGSVNIK